MRLHGGMRLRSFSRLFRARPKDVKWSNIYSLGSHTATRNSAHFFSVFFFSFFFSVKCWNAIVCVFCTPLRWKPYLSHIPEDSNSRFFWENAKKNEKKLKKKRKEHQKYVHDSQCNMRLPPWSAKETKYAQPNSTDMLSSAFGLFVCVRGGGMRCCRVCALNQHIPNRIS